MSEVFTPKVAELNSAVTPQEVAPNMGAVQLFSDVAQVATEATFSYTGQKELSELNSKFDRIIQARESGKSSSVLQVRAREDLNAAKANSPWVAEQADALFREKFSGGSGSTGIFKATPEEKANEEHQQLLQEIKLKRGLSSVEEAQKRLSLDENAKSAKIQADAQKQVRNYNGELVFSNTQAQVNNQSIKMMDAITRAMKLGGGTLSNDAIRDVNITVDQTALQMKQELNSQTRDERTGHLLIDKASYDANLKEIEDWVADTKAIASDNAYLKVVQDLNTEQSAEINYVASKKHRLTKEIASVYGQAGVKSFFDISLMPEGEAKNLLIKRSPFTKDMFKQPGSYKQASSTGFEKVMLPTPENILMSQAESIALGSTINDPRNAKVAMMVVDKVATEPEAVDPYKQMLKQDPDSSAMLWGKAFRDWSYQNKSKAGVVLKESVGALQSSFKSAYVSDNNSLPSDFTIKIGATRQTSGGAIGAGLLPQGGIPRNTVEGEGMTRESASILMNMYKVLKGNPEYLKQVSSEAGQELTAAQAVEYSVLGKLPPKEGDVDRSKLSDGSGTQTTTGVIGDALKSLGESIGTDLYNFISKKERAFTEGMSEEQKRAKANRDARRAEIEAEELVEDEAVKAVFEADMAAAKTELEKERVFGRLLRGEYRREGVVEKSKGAK